MKEKIVKYLENLRLRLFDKGEHKKLICVYTYIVMAIISFTMTIINTIQYSDVGVLMYSTLIMGVCSLINLWVSQKAENGVNISSVLFAVEIVALFTFFIISGNPNGFSIIWLSLLPPIAMLFFGRKIGSLLSGIMFVVLIFFLWVPFGHSLLTEEAKLSYTETFCLRFPFLYLGCYSLAFILDTLQSIAYDALEKSNEKNDYYTKHDFLTGLYNRTGILEILEKEINNPEHKRIGIGIMDIDKFKEINDKHGHIVGDKAIKKLGEAILKKQKVIACRWGGDEFAFAYFDDSVSEESLNDFRDYIKKTPLVFPEGKNIMLTISGGVYDVPLSKVNNLDDLDMCLKVADNLLYKAKENGRDQIITLRR